MRRRNKLVGMLFAAILAAVTVVGCGSKENVKTTEETTAEISGAESAETDTGENGTTEGTDQIDKALAYNLLTDGVITIGTDDTMPPMEYRDETNSLVGFDIDMGNEIAARLGLEIQWVPTDWDGLLLGLSGKKYDAVISLINITDERKETMDFSDPYYVLEELIITGKDNTEINSISDLPGKKVGCQTGSANYISLTEMDGINTGDVYQYNAVTDELQDITTGRLDCAVMESPTAYYYSQLNDALRVVDGEAIDGHEVGIVFDKGNDQLIAAVNKILADMKEDGTLSDISLKWFGVDVYAE